jgi:hypothetical protein
MGGEIVGGNLVNVVGDGEKTLLTRVGRNDFLVEVVHGNLNVVKLVVVYS